MIRVYHRIGPRTGISAPLWLALPVYMLWAVFVIGAGLVAAAVWLVVQLAIWGLASWRAHRSARSTPR